MEQSIWNYVNINWWEMDQKLQNVRIVKAIEDQIDNIDYAVPALFKQMGEWKYNQAIGKLTITDFVVI